ncbi:hypothetical protein [Nocardia goodfellowii]|uniref:Heavy metal-binding domain-containing protein n=1 Tax=Nocardia goodfellowii TaxID=882446 RepID=A0ABS4QBJ0_9NOCA|nr:hypothetical protein [Nocardia goodfellowii]MBP2189066.1 hypothetical protein [Nocardia goodfellowii]
MRDQLRLVAIGGVLVVLFAVALGIGALVGDPGDAADTGGAGATGLSDSESGYTLADLTAPAEPNQPGSLRFRIIGPDGTPVTRFTVQHEKQLHLIVVRTDLTQYRHAHPAMDATGTWSIDWTWDQPGDYRVFADFVPEAAGRDLVLGKSVTVAGTQAAQPLPPPARTSTVDGYQVTLTGEQSTAGSELRFTVTRDGKPVTDLQPYLGAYAHLVALRAGDLAYLHTHPLGELGKTPPGPEVVFHTTAPSAGDYRLYLDFSHGDSVHTAEFTATATDSTSPGGHSGHHN